MTFTAGVVTGIICTLLVSGLVLVLLMVASSHNQAEQAMGDTIKRTPRGYQPVMRDSIANPSPPGESTTLNAGVDITCTITANDDARWEPRRVKVRHKQPGDNYEDRNKIYYGQRFSGAIFDHIELVDPPKTEAGNVWIREHLMTRIAPGGKLRLSKDMVPHGRSDN